MTSPSLGLAFLAGLVSCLSPCVFPLLPGYVAYLGRQAVVVPATATGPAGVPTTARNSIVLISGAAFAAGFSTVFFADFWGTTNGCWEYYRLERPGGLWQGIAFGMTFDAVVVLASLRLARSLRL